MLIDVPPGLAGTSLRLSSRLLNLPDELLLVIYDQVWFSRNRIGSLTQSMAECLACKRTLRLAYPLWLSQLYLHDHLDRKLAGLHSDDSSPRRDYLRIFDMALTKTFSQLLKSAILRLPHLTHLRIDIYGDVSTQAILDMANAVSKLVDLDELTLDSPEGIDRIHLFFERCASNNFTPRCIKYENQNEPIYTRARVAHGGKDLYCVRYNCTSFWPDPKLVIDWASLYSLRLEGCSNDLVLLDKTLSKLKRAVQTMVVSSFSRRRTRSPS